MNYWIKLKCKCRGKDTEDIQDTGKYKKSIVYLTLVSILSISTCKVRLAYSATLKFWHIFHTPTRWCMVHCEVYAIKCQRWSWKQ